MLWLWVKWVAKGLRVSTSALGSNVKGLGYRVKCLIFRLGFQGYRCMLCDSGFPGSARGLRALYSYPRYMGIGM